MTILPFSSRIIIPLTMLGVIGFVGLNFNALSDEYALATFKPEADIAPIIEQSGLTKPARAALYRSKPSLDEKEAFSTNCQTNKTDIELGCFYRDRIFVLKIANADLAPEMVTVTSHETLHALWDDMSKKEREDLGVELERVYATIKDDNLRDRMAVYAREEPGQVPNELHSILGTEFETLSPMLEAHYARFFNDRKAVVAFHLQYELVFSRRRAQLDGQLAGIRALKRQLTTVNGQLARYKSEARYEAYNALIPRQNALVDQINVRIKEYQAGVDEYNALSKSLDSDEITPQVP